PPGTVERAAHGHAPAPPFRPLNLVPARVRVNRSGGEAGVFFGVRVLRFALDGAAAFELLIDDGHDLFVGEPAVVPEGGEGVARAPQTVAASGARRAALVGDDASGPASPDHGGPRQVLAELDEAVVAELLELRAQVRQRLVPMAFAVALDRVVHRLLLSCW